MFAHTRKPLCLIEALKRGATRPARMPRRGRASFVPRHGGPWQEVEVSEENKERGQQEPRSVPVFVATSQPEAMPWGQDSLSRRDVLERAGPKEADTTSLASDVPPIKQLALRRTSVLRSQWSKMVALDWSQDSQHILTASQDGYMIVWNAEEGYKVQAMKLPVLWVLCCAYSPSGRLVASGGLDNACTLYNLAERKKPYDVPMAKRLLRHKDYISACRFASDHELWTASGDGTVMQWDVQRDQVVSTLDAKQGDVLCLQMSPTDPHTLLTGGTSALVHMWDKRTAGIVRTFEGHRADVNALDFFPDGSAFATACEDSLCRLFDVRTGSELLSLDRPPPRSAATAVAFSSSGRLLFSGYDTHKMCVWDTLRGERISMLHAGHTHMAYLGRSPDGRFVASAGWDGKTIVWGI